MLYVWSLDFGLTGYTCGAELEKTAIMFGLAEPILGPSANAITKAAKENDIYVIVGILASSLVA